MHFRNVLTAVIGLVNPLNAVANPSTTLSSAATSTIVPGHGMGNMSMPLHNMTMPHHGNMTMPKPYNGTHIHAPSCTCPTCMRPKPQHNETATTHHRSSSIPHHQNSTAPIAPHPNSCTCALCTTSTHHNSTTPANTTNPAPPPPNLKNCNRSRDCVRNCCKLQRPPSPPSAAPPITPPNAPHSLPVPAPLRLHTHPLQARSPPPKSVNGKTNLAIGLASAALVLVCYSRWALSRCDGNGDAVRGRIRARRGPRMLRWVRLGSGPGWVGCCRSGEVERCGLRGLGSIGWGGRGWGVWMGIWVLGFEGGMDRWMQCWGWVEYLV